ncbi:MAG TPA: glutamate racemase [Saprospiraceae bacterium]|nr:glutamate racemase [Saprospiraceae bacterium]
MQSARQERPIGVFDSGIGGLTVAQAITRVLPDEQMIYFGDTAHMPYGDKSVELIQKYSTRIVRFLLDKYHCKAIVIACNTASAAAYVELRDALKGEIPVINVIDPMVERVVSDANLHHVGIIATLTTIRSGVYQEKLTRRRPDLKYSALATPLLAPMIEEGFFENNISNAVLHEYLDSEILDGIDSLILACTHYPLIKKEIEAFYSHQVTVIDSALVVAEKLLHILKKEGLLNSIQQKNNHHFFVSDLSDHFRKAVKIFYGDEINLEKVTI